MPLTNNNNAVESNELVKYHLKQGKVIVHV